MLGINSVYDRHSRRGLLASSIILVGLFSARTTSAAPLNRDTVRPLLIADVNALQANRYFLQSMLAFNSTPFTIGYGTQQASVKFLRIDDEIVDGSLSKDQLVMSLGFGRPATGIAAYGVLNFAGATAGNFPRPPLTNMNSLNIRATHSAVFLAFGVAVKGWVLQYGWRYNQLRVHADQNGRLTYCGDQGYCLSDEYPTRLGAPNRVVLETNKHTASNKILSLENGDGYSVGALLASLRDLGGNARGAASSSLAALRLLAQPDWVAESFGTAYGVGLNTYAKQIDYYGDLAAERARATREGLPLPRSAGGIVEIPLVADRIMGTGFAARLVGQLAPSLTPRLAEVGYIFAGDEAKSFVPNFGARAKVFRRADSLEFSTDAYAGLFWTTTRSTSDDEGRGMSLFATYSYNSPDASNFIPLPRSHVIGAQVVWGNPAGLAPPVAGVRIPKSARYEGAYE